MQHTKLEPPLHIPTYYYFSLYLEQLAIAGQHISRWLFVLDDCWFFIGAHSDLNVTGIFRQSVQLGQQLVVPFFRMLTFVLYVHPLP